MNDDVLEQQLREATDGLTFMSESDYPVEVVRWAASTEVTPEYLRGVAGQDASAPVETTTVEDFFRVAASEPDWKGEAEIATARKFQKVVRLLNESLQDSKVHRVGAINIPVYAVGRAPSGDWLGVSTRVVET